MPVRRGRDSSGPFYQWGEHGKKYYYLAGSTISRNRAHDKAALQGRAIKARQIKY
jgi:hypothetical protein